MMKKRVCDVVGRLMDPSDRGGTLTGTCSTQWSDLTLH